MKMEKKIEVTFGIEKMNEGRGTTVSLLPTIFCYKDENIFSVGLVFLAWNFFIAFSKIEDETC